MIGAVLGIILSHGSACADWGSLGYGGTQSKWNIFNKKNRSLTPEEQRLNQFWHDYYDALKRDYGDLDHIDWVAYYKNHGYPINPGCGGPNGGQCNINYAPVMVAPTMTWAVPPAPLCGPPSGPSLPPRRVLELAHARPGSPGFASSARPRCGHLSRPASWIPRTPASSISTRGGPSLTACFSLPFCPTISPPPAPPARTRGSYGLFFSGKAVFAFAAPSCPLKGVIMRAAFSWLAALLCVIAAGSLVQAQPYYAPCPPPAPDACGSGFYAVNPQCGTYGPCCYLRPPFPPSVDCLPACGHGPQQCGQQPVLNGPPPLPIHLFARSPRDYFMQD